DVESLRQHYALTLDAWGQRLERHHQDALRAVGEVTYRVWRVYMAMAAYQFRLGRLSLHHTVCVKAVDGQTELPLTRKDWYESRISEARVHQEAA
ncbi:MAG TPA: class I SAM-dependent methyltransferase, partial [Nitrospira sp.]|nr:class I SAM-dependent methyltransferase [Nitrospira sp.]